GLPVILHHNNATELCMTKGQEGHVVGWDAVDGQYGTKALETVYVKLDLKLPRKIQLPNLPENVVPITKSKNKVKCDLPNDKYMNVEQEQVNILPNFSMTDYSSQGKTRKCNVVDLSMTKSTQGVYTAISRSSDAKGTVILQSFDVSKITGGISGYLRQEFRETMILDKITELRYRKELPPNVRGALPDTLAEWHPSLALDIGESFVPNDNHSYLWNERSDSEWTIDYEERKRRQREQVAEARHLKAASSALHVGKPVDGPPADTLQSLKRKRAISVNSGFDSGLPSLKRARDGNTSVVEQVPVPVGFIWDHVNYSCAYDAIFTILYSIWNKEPQMWGPRFHSLGPFMAHVAHWFDKIQPLTLEQVHDEIRQSLMAAYPDLFPQGRHLTSMEHLLGKLLGDVEVAHTILKCPTCALTIDDDLFSLSQLTTLYSNYWLHNQMYCTCGPDSRMDSLLVRTREISIVVMEVVDRRMQLEPKISLKTSENKEIQLTLQGLIYLGNAHFSSRIIDLEGRIWHHDGATTGRVCQFDGHRDSNRCMEDLWDSRGKRLSYAVYASS
ncbi:hypothetical protein BKA70DRAFT_1123454, partial [Coprinopsis sp. MPI-PUGE-AT-0042]